MTHQDEITCITVEGIPVGIQGLKAIMDDMSAEYKERTDSDIIEGLLNRLSEKNYIPEAVKEKYGRALLREFYKYMGKPCEDEESSRGKIIKVLGAGCPQCDKLENELMNVMDETGIPADLEHIRDAAEIGKYGVMGTPALIINGEVKSVGSVPERSKLINWLKNE